MPAAKLWILVSIIGTLVSVKGWEWRRVNYFKRAALLASDQLSSE
jgi:hypothetical protein